MTPDWEAVYRATLPDLVRFLHRKVWDEDRARELAQEAFVRGLREDPPPDRPRAWLFTVAGNLARDEAQRSIRRRRHLTLLASEMESRETTAPDPARELDRRRRADRLRRALEELGERDREVVLLWDAGFSYREIADETGLAPASIGTTLARARRRLVQAYEDAGGSDAASDRR